MDCWSVLRFHYEAVAIAFNYGAESGEFLPQLPNYGAQSREFSSLEGKINPGTSNFSPTSFSIIGGPTLITRA